MSTRPFKCNKRAAKDMGSLVFRVRFLFACLLACLVLGLSICVCARVWGEVKFRKSPYVLMHHGYVDRPQARRAAIEVQDNGPPIGLCEKILEFLTGFIEPTFGWLVFTFLELVPLLLWYQKANQEDNFGRSPKQGHPHVNFKQFSAANPSPS